MSLSDTLTATLHASLWFSWIGLLIAVLPSIFAMAIAERDRLQYLIVGLLGGIAGESCGVASLFLSLYFSCLGQQNCNTAQGDMGLLITLPVGSILGCLFTLFWTWATLNIASDSPWAWISHYSGAKPVKNWTYVIGVPIALLVLATIFFARLMD
jgi:hypothetical protein